jgi:hypothetical protein
VPCCRLRRARARRRRTTSARSTDDADAIERAIAESEGGVVFLPAGTYLVRRTLRVPPEVTLRGEGVARTVVVFDGPSAQMQAADGAIVVLERLAVHGGDPFA